MHPTVKTKMKLVQYTQLKMVATGSNRQCLDSSAAAVSDDSVYLTDNTAGCGST